MLCHAMCLARKSLGHVDRSEGACLRAMSHQQLKNGPDFALNTPLHDSPQISEKMYNPLDVLLFLYCEIWIF